MKQILWALSCILAIPTLAFSQDIPNRPDYSGPAVFPTTPDYDDTIRVDPLSCLPTAAGNGQGTIFYDHAINDRLQLGLKGSFSKGGDVEVFSNDGGMEDLFTHGERADQGEVGVRGQFRVSPLLGRREGRINLITGLGYGWGGTGQKGLGLIGSHAPASEVCPYGCYFAPYHTAIIDLGMGFELPLKWKSVKHPSVLEHMTVGSNTVARYFTSTSRHIVVEPEFTLGYRF